MNRALSSFCRGCGSSLPEGEDWSGTRGGVQRLGWNPGRSLALPVSWVPTPRPDLHRDLESPCRAVLSLDGFLVLVAANGRVEWVDPVEPDARQSFATLGSVSGEPAISRGVLYLASENRVGAWPLVWASLHPPRTTPLWEVALPGRPLGGLLPFGDRLYLQVLKGDGQVSVQVLEGLRGATPPVRREVTVGAERVSPLVGNPALAKVLFLSSSSQELRLHWESVGEGARPGFSSRRIAGSPGALVEHRPVAALGGKLFAVLGDDEALCRLDSEEIAFDQILLRDCKAFAMNGLADGLAVQADRVHFLAAAVHDELGRLQRVKGQPLLLGDRAAAIGLTDGRVLLYDFARPPASQLLRLRPRDEQPVAVLASFGDYLVAGDAAGHVAVWQFAAAR
ncbi:MAG: hypothetical protein SF066_23690 [Thermoanaerobaculia bacterium]|nr:hypothetical protein [Thermoanaerobaculia bacterium]